MSALGGYGLLVVIAFLRGGAVRSGVGVGGTGLWVLFWGVGVSWPSRVRLVG